MWLEDEADKVLGADVKTWDDNADGGGEVVDDWDAEEEEPVETKPRGPSAEDIRKQKKAEEAARKKKLEELKREDPEARKERIKRETEQAALKDVDDLFGGIDEAHRPVQVEKKESVAEKESKAEVVLLEKKEHFVKYATTIAAQIAESVKGKAHRIPFAGDFVREIVKQCAPIVSEASLRELTTTVNAAIREKNQEKAAAKKSLF
jgi:hypothetical protein